MRHWLTWNVLFRLHERAKGHATFRILKDMEEADRLSAAELEQLQQRKLQEFLSYCYAHVPYIRSRMDEAGVRPDQIKTRSDLALLPLMRKADVRNGRANLRSDLAKDLTPFTTGGSTGEPLIFELGKRRVAARVACRQRVDRWWGLSVGDPELALWGSPIEATRQDWIRGLRDTLMATRLLSAFEMNESTMSSYLDILEKGSCRQIFAYPSAIYQLCSLARKQGRNLRRRGIRTVFVTGEVLFPYQRQLIAEVLNCPVADGYGGRDSGFISHECPQGGMHVLADAVIVEIVGADGRPVPPGESGEIVVTDLYSHEFPFLRYATGDVAALSSRSCTCGRALPLLERIEGRSNDSVIAPDGRIINSLSVIYAVREIEGVEQFRVVQKTIDTFHVQIVRNERYRTEDEARIQNGWTKLLRAPLSITFEYLTALPAERSGKFRHVVSEIPAGRAPRDMAAPESGRTV